MHGSYTKLGLKLNNFIPLFVVILRRFENSRNVVE